MNVPLSARIGTGELAALVGCSREYVARQCRSGAWPSSSVRTRYRFTPSDVATILALTRKPGVRRAALEFAELPADARIADPKPRRAALDVHRYTRMRIGQ